MIGKLSWNRFELKFEGKQESAFEELAKSLFCSEFSVEGKLTGCKNHPGLEANPIFVGTKHIGFQAKYAASSVRLSSKKQEIIKSIRLAREHEENLDEIHIYINKLQTKSSKPGVLKSQFVSEIEKEAGEIFIVWHFWDNISNQLVEPKNKKLLKTYFPEFIEKNLVNQHKTSNELTLDLCRTAQIQLEFSKLKFEFGYDWGKNEKILDQLQIYAEFKNEIIARDIFVFLSDHVSSFARSGMPSPIASSIFSLILDFFPSSHGTKDKNKRLENGTECIEIGFNLIYDAFIYSKNYKVARWGLTCWKYIYRESKRHEYLTLCDSLLEKYTEIEEQLNRPEPDLVYAREMVQIFKADLETEELSFPYFPEHIDNLVQKSL